MIISDINTEVNVEDYFYINDNGVHKYFDAYNCKIRLVTNPDTTQNPDDPSIADTITVSEWTEKGVTNYTLLNGYIDHAALEVYGDGLTELLSMLSISNIPLIVLKSS